jgi:CheY-like chemotaxis protein
MAGKFGLKERSVSEESPLILIADDEDDIKMILGMYLETCGFRVLTAYDGLDAIERIKESKPDLILMDIMMPVLDGVEVTRQIKATEETRDIPIVMLTAAAQSEMVERALKAGAEEYIAKPFEPDRVKEIIDRILSRKRS